MEETGISKAEQVMLLKGLIEEGVRQKREMVFRHREAQDEMLRYGILLGFLTCVGLVSVLRDVFVSGRSVSLLAFGGLIDIFLLLVVILGIAFAVKCVMAYAKYANPILMKDGTELSFREAAASIDSQTKRNFRKLIEIRQSMTPAEADASRIEPYRFDTVNGGYYTDVARATEPLIEKYKEEINEKRKIVVSDLEEIQIHRKMNRQMMILAIVVAVVSRILDIPIAKHFPPMVWKVWMVMSYLLFYGGVALAVFYGIRYLYEKRDNRLIPSITLIDRDENSIENYNYLLTDIEFMLACVRRRKEPAWNKPVVDANEAKTISMTELTQAVVEAGKPKFGGSASQQSPYDLSYGRAETTVEVIDLMPNQAGNPTKPITPGDRTEVTAQGESQAESADMPVENTAPADAYAEQAAPAEAREADHPQPAAASNGEPTEEETAANEQKKLEEYMRDLKRKAQDELEFSEELMSEMERIRKAPEEVIEEKEEAPKHPASSNLFYYPTATTREQTPFEEQDSSNAANSYISHSAHAAEQQSEEEGEHAAFRHRTGGEKDKYSYDGRPKKTEVLRRVQASSDQDPVQPVTAEEQDTPVRPAPEPPKAEEKKASLRTSEEFQNSMTEHMRSLQEDYGKRDTSDRDPLRHPGPEVSHVRMDRDQGLTISLEDALKDLESFEDEDE